MTRAPWRTALVTGASSGIGEALARELASLGVRVTLASRREARLRSVAEQIEAQGGRADVVVMDVTRPDEAAQTVRRVDADVDGLELVVANAGLGHPQSARELGWPQARDVVATNFTGAIATLTAVLPRLVERGRGHLVGISSVAAFAPTPNGATYRATKAGLTAFLDNLRAELGATGVGVTVVHPGFVRTPLAEAFPMEPPLVLTAEAAARTIVRRLPANPREINFPWSVASMMRLMGALPRALVHQLVRRVDLTSNRALRDDNAS